MRKIIQILVVILIIMVPVILTAQPHPYDPSIGGGTGNPTGGAAPIGSGLLILLSMAIGYGSKKVYNALKLNKHI